MCAGPENNTTVNRWNFLQWIFRSHSVVLHVSVSGKLSRKFSSLELRLERSFSFSILLANGLKVFQVAADSKQDKMKNCWKVRQSVVKVSQNWSASQPKVPTDQVVCGEKWEKSIKGGINWKENFFVNFPHQNIEKLPKPKFPFSKRFPFLGSFVMH